MLLGLNHVVGARLIPSGLAAILQSATPIFALVIGALAVLGSIVQGSPR